jgi:hypothetical protein
VSRNEVEVDLEKEGLWKPYRAVIVLPAGLTVVGRGWTADGALKNAVRSLRKIVGVFFEENKND